MGKDNLEITDFSWYENPYAYEDLIGVSDEGFAFVLDAENGNVISVKATEDIRDWYEVSHYYVMCVQNKLRNMAKLNQLELFIEPPCDLFLPKIVGRDKNDREYELSHYTGKLVPVMGDSIIGKNWESCSFEKAKKIQMSFFYSPQLLHYIDYSAAELEENQGKCFGTDFRFYLNDNDFVFAIDENDNHYSCTASGMIMAEGNIVDCMWGGVSQWDVLKYIRNM